MTLPTVTYLDENGVTQTLTNYEYVTDSTSSVTWNANTWYVVGADYNDDGKIDAADAEIAKSSNGTYKYEFSIDNTVYALAGAKLILADGFSLTVDASTDHAAIENGTNAFTIYGQNNGTGTLTAKRSDNGAGIGGGNNGDGSNITINGGTINVRSWSSSATGYSRNGAAIGGGNGGDGSNITINGGTITCSGGNSAAIGGGSEGDGFNITINGGTIEAEGYHGAGIGGGSEGDGFNITINGGSISASGGFFGAAIGGGDMGNGHDITINDGAVKASAGWGAGIGGGSEDDELTIHKGGNGQDITINDGTILAFSMRSSGIGGGFGGTGCNISINGGNVYAIGTYNGDALGGTAIGASYGCEQNATNITIDGGISVDGKATLTDDEIESFSYYLYDPGMGSLPTTDVSIDHTSSTDLSDTLKPYHYLALTAPTLSLAYTLGDNVSAVYDGEAHSVSVTVTTPAEGATVSYSLDGGKTWNAGNSYSLSEIGIADVCFKVEAVGYVTEITDSRTIAILPENQSAKSVEFKVYSGYTGYEIGDPVCQPGTSTLDSGYYFGQNAFATFNSAFAFTQTNTIIIYVLSGDTQYWTPSASACGDVNLQVNTGSTLTLQGDLTWGKSAEDASTIYIQNNAVLNGEADADVTLQGRTSIWLQGKTNPELTKIDLQGNLALDDESAIYGKGTLNADGLSMLGESSVILDKSTVTIDTVTTIDGTGICLNASQMYVKDTGSALGGDMELLGGTDLWLFNDTADATFTNNGTITATGTDSDDATISQWGNSGTFVNNGTIRLDRANITGLSEALTLTNSGTIDGTDAAIVAKAATNAKTGVITLKDDGSSLYVQNTLTNKGKITLDGVDSISATTVDNSGTIAIANLDGMANTSVFTNSGTLTMDETSKLTATQFVMEDDGVVNFVLDEDAAHIYTNDFTIADGDSATLSVDMGDAAGKAYTLVDLASPLNCFFNANCFSGYSDNGLTPITVAGKGTLDVDFNGAQYEEFAFVQAINGIDATQDLYAVQTSNIQINYTTDAYQDVTFDAAGDWRVQGINWFTSLEEASDATSWGSRTYEFVYEDNAQNDTMSKTNMTLLVTVDTGTTHVTIAEKSTGEVLNSFNVSTGRAVTVALEEKQTYTITFDGDNADYDFSAYFQDTDRNSECDLGLFGGTTAADLLLVDEPSDPDANYHRYTFTDVYDATTDTYGTTNKVGFGTDAQIYTFEIDDNDSGMFTFTIGTQSDPDAVTDDDRISYRIEETTNGKTIAFGSVANGRTITRNANLLSGTYKITIDSYDHGKGGYNAIYSLGIVGIRNENVVKDDNSISSTAAMNVLDIDGAQLADYPMGDDQINWNVKDFVGLGDKTDWVAVDFDEKSGNYDIAVQTEEDTESAGLRISLVCQNAAGNSSVIQSMTYKGGTAYFKDVALDASMDYYLKVTVPSASSDSFNSNYILGIHRVSENSGINHDDDVRDGHQTLAVLDNIVDWVGTEDTVDWIKLDVTEGEYNLVLETQGDRMTATIYGIRTIGTGSSRREFGALQTVTTLNVTDQKTIQQTLSCADDYNYYVRLKSSSGSDVSTDYKLGLAMINF